MVDFFRSQKSESFWYVIKLLVLLVVLKLLTVVGLEMASLRLTPQEACNWVQSKGLFAGTSCPFLPLSWQIQSGCMLFGDTECGVRFGGVILSLLLSFAVFFFGKALRS